MKLGSAIKIQDTGSVSKEPKNVPLVIRKKYLLHRRYPKYGSPSQIQSQKLVPILDRPNLYLDTAQPWPNPSEEVMATRRHFSRGRSPPALLSPRCSIDNCGGPTPEGIHREREREKTSVARARPCSLVCAAHRGKEGEGINREGSLPPGT